ncbi:MAG: bacterial peptide chain release factor 1 (brf-1), peptide chain release factor 1 [candidate division WS6 bacterium GW2011_GWC1_33_20]|nr:MAG: bacterial peptide chain release factor 1 (brf-1), peptide chain release factor 1 [candidate division WS6 bacterium GW2011_GWE2_33_157]KKP44677.1 MAG: bacterial peptide chain release factor 1 (brf-1), peptide chain release factor 1 [candidate division WS6 bacterium GW2011_GWC1_33_20]KKP45982.1 MAG: bacterial peptide chain release factor 1 (brf-1), peptide chain release factor 1 [candidate division WS6 bacterium GW2011_GWF1_33_233]KKP55586.1 MAG: bacterial peptide chain release factor 1 (b
MDIQMLKTNYQIEEIKTKKEALESKMSNIHNGENMSQLSSDLNYYSQLYFHTQSIQNSIKKYEEAENILKESNDKELIELANQEIEDVEEKIKEEEESIKKLKIEREFTDVDDNRSAILEIRAGAGGDEASLFAAELFNMYKNFALKNGWEIQIIDSSVTEGGGYKEVIAHINGKNVFKKLKYESGVHRVQRVPVTESSGRIHTSTASVAILPEAKEIDIQINPEDIRIDVMRASGAGGQCVNRTDSAVRITHFETGIVVSCQETKHQAQNKEKAMALLRSRLYEKKRQEEADKRSNMRSSQIGGGMRAEKIRTYNFPQNRITDHRVKKSWHNIEEVLSGDLEKLTNDVIDGIQLELLKNEK